MPRVEFTEIYRDTRGLQHSRQRYFSLDLRDRDFGCIYAGDALVNFTQVKNWDEVNNATVCAAEEPDKYEILAIGGYSREKGLFYESL